MTTKHSQPQSTQATAFKWKNQYRDAHLRKKRLHENPGFPIAICGCHKMTTSRYQSQQQDSTSTHPRCQNQCWFRSFKLTGLKKQTRHTLINHHVNHTSPTNPKLTTKHKPYLVLQNLSGRISIPTIFITCMALLLWQHCRLPQN